MKFQFPSPTCEICGKNRKHHSQAEQEKCSRLRKELNQHSETLKPKRAKWNDKSVDYMVTIK